MNLTQYTPKRSNFFRSLYVIIPAAIIGFAMIGCGGGGASTTGGSTGGATSGGTSGGDFASFALHGTVQAPGASASGRGPEDYLPVPNATVTLTDLGTGNTIATTTTDSDGEYGFNEGLVEGTDYQIEAEADFDGKNIKLKSLVNIEDVETPESRNLDPITTTASEAALNQLEAAKQADPDFRFKDIEDLVKDLESQVGDDFVAPDLSDENARKEAGASILNRRKADGNYIGRYNGDSSGNLAAIIKNGKFMVVGISDGEFAALSTVTKNDTNDGETTGGGGGSTTGGGNDDGNENEPGDNNGDGEVNYDDGPDNPIALGELTLGGILMAETNDGKFSVSGVLLGNFGVGNWKRTTDNGVETGTWSMNRRVFTHAGFYAGNATPTEGGEGIEEGDNGGGYVIVLVTEDRKLAFILRNTYNNVVGFGSVETNGSYNFTYFTQDGETGTASGTISSEGGIQGALTPESGFGFDWNAGTNFDPAEDFE